MTRPASIARAAVFCPGTVVVYVGVRAQEVRHEEHLPADHACTEAAHLRAGRTLAEPILSRAKSAFRALPGRRSTQDHGIPGSAAGQE